MSARAVLESVGLIVAEEGTGEEIIGQAPAAGSRSKAGQVVTITAGSTQPRKLSG